MMPGFALLDDELGAGNEKHRRADHRHAQMRENCSQVAHWIALHEKAGF